MYQLLQLTSTPLGRKCSSLLKKETEYSTPSFQHSFSSCGAHGDSSPEHSCIGSHLAYRRSPRLLTNGYYILNEDSFLFDDQGNITVSPCHSVSYKENLVRIFRKKKKLRRTLANLFNLGSSHPWLQSGNAECPPVPMSQAEEDSYMESSGHSDYDNDELSHHQKVLTSAPETPVSHESPYPTQSSRKVHCSSPESPIMHFYRERNQNDFMSGIQPAVSSESSPAVWSTKRIRCSSPDSYVRAQKCFYRKREIMPTKISKQMIVLLVCLILSVCARCVLGGLFVSWLAFILVIALTCVIKPSLSRFFKAFKLRT